MAEKRVFRYDDELRKNGIWVNIDHYTVNPDFYLFPSEYDDEEPQNCLEIARENRFYKGRDYFLFGILAGIRGFVGHTIASPKGVPLDVSPEVKKAIEDYGSDGHSHTFLTLKELQDFDWNQTVEDEDIYWVNDTNPEDTAKESRRLEKKREELKLNNRFLSEEIEKGGIVRLKYLQSLAELNPDFQETIKRLEGYLKDKRVTSEDIRLVFWFDN